MIFNQTFTERLKIKPQVFYWILPKYFSWVQIKYWSVIIFEFPQKLWNKTSSKQVLIREGSIIPKLRCFGHLKCTYFIHLGSDEVAVYAPALCRSLNGFIWTAVVWKTPVHTPEPVQIPAAEAGRSLGTIIPSLLIVQDSSFWQMLWAENNKMFQRILKWIRNKSKLYPAVVAEW